MSEIRANSGVAARNEIYNLNIKNIKLTKIFKNILIKLLENPKIQNDKKYEFIKCFTKYNERQINSYKQQIHYEALCMELIHIYHK